MKNLLEIAIMNQVPEIIIWYFNEVNPKTESVISKNHKGEDIKEYYKPFPVINLYNKDNISFYCLEQYYKPIDNYLKQGICFNKNGKKINNDDFIVFLNSYGNGFQKGYNDFCKKIKSSEIFNFQNDEIAYKIFSRVRKPSMQKTGKFIFSTNWKITESTIDGKIQTPITKAEKVVIDEKGFFDSGYGGGEFYKAWELIFENPNIFEPLFIKYYEQMKNELLDEIELNDLSEAKPEIKENPFPSVFLNYEVYKWFIEYTQKHIIEFYLDYSYLKKRLENLKLIHYHKDIEFVNFLLNDIKLITEKNNQTFISKESKLKSLKSSYSLQRENNFNIVFNI